MEIFVQSFARKVLIGEKYLVSEAYFSFVAFDEDGKAVPVIAVKPATKPEKWQYDTAAERKKRMIKFKKVRTGLSV